MDGLAFRGAVFGIAISGLFWIPFILWLLL